MSGLLTRIRSRARRRILTDVWRVWNRLAPGRVRTFPFDATLDLKVRYPIGSSLGYGLFLGEYENAELKFMRRVLRPGDVVFDVGANGGIFTVVAARTVGAAGRVVSFEPGEAEIALLRENLRLNDLANVMVVEGAVSNCSGQANLAVARDGALNSLAKTEHPSQVIERWRTVSTVTLDDFMTREGIRKVDFIKIDVEGAEKLVFEGARNLLKSAESLTVLFEAFDANAAGFHYTVKQLFEELFCAGLKLSHISEDGRLVEIQRHEPRFGRDIYNFVAQK